MPLRNTATLDITMIIQLDRKRRDASPLWLILHDRKRRLRFLRLVNWTTDMTHILVVAGKMHHISVNRARTFKLNTHIIYKLAYHTIFIRTLGGHRDCMQNYTYSTYKLLLKYEPVSTDKRASNVI